MRYAPLLLVLAVALLALGQVAGHGFLSWDDDVFFTQNPHLQPPTAASLKAYWTGPYAHLYAPVTYTAWWLLARVAGAAGPDGVWRVSPAVFHLASLLAHLLAVALAYALLLALVHSRRAAVAGALVFAVHPLQVEAVAWASELKDLLGGLFGLLAVWLVVRARHTGRTWPYVAATLAFVLAMLSKPNLVSLPLVVLVVDGLLLRTPWRRALLSVAPWFVLALAQALLTRAVQPPSPLLAPPLWQRLFVAGDALAFYLAKLVWPLQLAADYGRQPQLVVTHWWGYVTWLAPAGLLAAAVLLRRRSRWALPALLWFGLALVPVLGLLPFDFQQYSTPADHYAYLALFGPALALAGLTRSLKGFYGRLPVVVLPALLAAQSGLQTITWANNETFWRHTLEVNARSFLAHNNLGAVYMLSGKLAQAAVELEAAVALQPDDPDALVNLGMVLVRAGLQEKARGFLERGLRARPEDPKAHLMLGMIAVDTGDYGTALAHLQPLAAADPADPVTHTALARALAGLGRTAEARAVLQEVLRHTPGYRPAVEALSALPH
jgi:tetratricopeptide (TPR) repeat protein